MKDIKHLSDDTIVEIALPRALYERVKKQLEKKKLNEGKSTIYVSYNNSPDDLDYIESVLANADISSSVEVGGFDEVEIIVDKKDIKRAIDALRADGIQAS